MNAVLGSRRGSILVAVTFMMLVLVLMGITGVAMLVNQAQTSISVVRGVKALAARQGIAEYLQRRMQYDFNWLNPSSPETVTLGDFTTTVTYSNILEDSVRVSTATIESSAGSEAQSRVIRRQGFDLKRAPTSLRFSLFNGSSSTTTLNNCNIAAGDIYSKVALVLPSPTAVGTNVHIYSAVANPQPSMPRYDLGTSPAGVLPELDGLIAQANIDSPNTDCLITSGETVSGTRMCRDLIIRGTSVTLNGNGKIIAWRNAYLQDQTGGSCAPANGSGYVSSDGGCKRVSDPNLDPDNQLVWGLAWAADEWTDALAFCAGQGQRLPTEGELTRAVGNSAFQFVMDEEYWQSVPERTVHMTSGAVGDYTASNPLEQRPYMCVRTAAAGATPAKTLTITPSGGDIVIAAGGSIYLTDDTQRFVASSTTGVTTLYSKTGNLHLTSSRYSWSTQTPTSMTNAVLMGRSKIYVGPKTRLLRALVFMPSGQIDITGDGTTSGRPIIEGVVASLSPSIPAVRLRNTVKVDGVIYASGGTDSTGTLEILNVTGEASVLANKFHNDQINGLVLTGPYNRTEPMPGNSGSIKGFSGTVSVVDGSWTAS